MRKLAVLALLAATPAWAANLNVSVKSGGLNEITVAPNAVVNYEVRGILTDGNNGGLALVGFSLHHTGGALTQANAPTGTASCSNQMRNFVIPEGITNPAGYGGTVIAGDLVQVGGGQNTINNTAESGAAFPVGSVLTGVAKPTASGGCGEAVLVTGSLTASSTPGDYQLQLFDLFANVIKLGETGVPFWATEAAGAGTVANLVIHVSGIVDGADLLSSTPAHRSSLWRTQKNIARLKFDANISLPNGNACPLLIQEITGGAVCSLGANLASGFTCTVENDPSQGNTPRILKVQETASVLGHRKWYGFKNDPAWLGVDNFNLQLIVQMGDSNEDLRINTLDGGAIYPQIPCVAGCGDARRADINGDQRINTLDPAQVFPKIPSLPVTFPAVCN